MCTTEFIAFQEIYPELKKMNTELLGLSIDSVHSHIAWVRNIEEKFNVKIEFPVIADLNKDVAHKYGMIMPEGKNTETSRAVFVIDGDQIIRAVVYYPLTTGRNMPEFLRLIQALQTTDQHGIATPANWQPGDKVIVPPADDPGAGRRTFKRYIPGLHRLVHLQKKHINDVCHLSNGKKGVKKPHVHRKTR